MNQMQDIEGRLARLEGIADDPNQGDYLIGEVADLLAVIQALPTRYMFLARLKRIELRMVGALRVAAAEIVGTN